MNGNGESNEIAKKIIKKAIMAAAKPLIIGILILAIVLIALSSILNFLTVLDGTPQDSDWSNVPYAKSQYVKNISIDNDGKITTEMSIDEIWNKLEKNHSRVNQYLSNADELKKLINAELITDYLDTRPNPDDSIDWDSIYGDTSSKDIQGIIKLKRAMSDGTIVTMQYAKPEEFQGNLDRYNSRGNYEDNAAKNYLLTHFTIDKEVSTNKSDSDKTSKNGDETDNNTSTNIKYYAKVATWTSEEITVTSTDPDVESSDTKKYTMTTTKINYQDLVSGYTMPFEYLWAFLLVGQEKEFVLELADLVYNSEIEITVHDNLTTNTNTETDEYTKKTKVVTKDVNVDVSYHTAAGADDPASPTKAQGTQIKTNSKMEEPRSIEQTEDYKVVRTEITTTNSLDTCVTKANTWVVNYTKKYTHQIPNSQTTAGDNADEYEEPYPSTPDHTDNIDTAGIAETYRQEIEKDLKEKLYSNILTNITSLTSEYYYSTEGKKSTINTTQSSKYVSSPATTEEKTDKDSDEPNFVTIYRKKEHQQNASNINSAPLWLFELLEKNDSTKDSMVDLTKYLLYKATGKDYGVTEFDFNVYDPANFVIVTGLYGNTIEEKVWFALRDAGFSEYSTAGAMGNIYAESGFNPDVIEKGNGIGFGLCQWSFGRRAQLENYATSKGAEPGDVTTQMEFLITELTPGAAGPAQGYASYQLLSNNGYNGDSWKNATSPEDAATAFCWSFERPGEPRLSVRQNKAREYYKQFQGKTRPAGDASAILAACEEVKQTLLNRNAHYPRSSQDLDYNDIEKSWTNYYCCCATYVSLVLWRSGALTTQQINAYNCNYTGDGGIPDMLAAAGWSKVSPSEAQPGDVVIDYTVHALIYAGNGRCWDQNSCVVPLGGGKPTRTTTSYDLSKCQIWRAP
ncbi:MAG: phage tail tip lysozyme [Clostridia bacterium]